MSSKLNEIIWRDLESVPTTDVEASAFENIPTVGKIKVDGGSVTSQQVLEFLQSTSDSSKFPASGWIACWLY